MKNDLINLITNKKAHVGVIGLGYVGLPLVVEFASKGFQGTGFEVDESKAEQINAGGSYIGDVPSRKVKEAVDAKRLRATTDFSHLRECDAIIICVPTPLTENKRTGRLLHPRGRRTDRKQPAPWPVDHSGVDHLSGHH